MNNENRYALFETAMEADFDAYILRADSAYALYAARYGKSKFRKKLLNPNRDVKVIRKDTLNAFLEVSDDAWLRSQLICLTDEEICTARLFIERVLENYTTFIAGSVQDTLSIYDMFSMWRFGPGSSKGLGFATHAYDKLHTEKVWTVTEGCLPIAFALIKSDPYLFHTMRKRDWAVSVVDGSTMTTVPKNETKDRTICTEPLLNMMCQLAAGSYIEGALKHIGLDISRQQDMRYEYCNQRLAWKGSIDGSLSTIDMSSASDYLSSQLISLLWPSKWVELLTAIRSPKTCIDGTYYDLPMMGTMGNGFTFPMMTLTLLALSSTAMGRNSFRRSDSAVFGDDIIVPTEYFTKVCEILYRAGLLVNKNKSFSSDTLFRESCGGDYFCGGDVTPPYVSSLNTVPDCYIAINSLLDYALRTGILLGESLAYLISLIRKVHGEELLLVPEWDQPYAGIRCAAVYSRRYTRYAVKIRSRVRKCENTPMTRLSILAGYVSGWQRQGRLCFSPRATHVAYEVEARVPCPRGYGNGRCVSSYTDRESGDRLVAMQLVGIL